jgi:hypothetical protein
MVADVGTKMLRQGGEPGNQFLLPCRLRLDQLSIHVAVQLP